MLSCLTMMPMIYFKGADIASQLRQGVDEYELLANKAWLQVTFDETYVHFIIFIYRYFETQEICC